MKTKKHRIDKTTYIELPASLKKAEVSKRIESYKEKLLHRGSSGINGLQF